MAEEKEPTDDRKALAERLIAWASVAYGLGFAVVLLHTARLGVPVLELVKPIYILIGLPLALLAFFSRQILKWLRAEAIANRDELAAALREQHILESDQQKDVIEKVVRSLSRAMPWYFPAKAFGRALGRLLQRAHVGQDSASGRSLFSTQILDGYVRSLEGAVALKRLMNLVLLVAVSGFLVYQYVWELYPKMPMAYGGGAPTSVQLIIDASKVPSDIARLMGAANVGGEESSLTAKLDLLYITSNAYLVRPQQGSVLSIDREAVNGVLFADRPKRRSPGQP